MTGRPASARPTACSASSPGSTKRPTPRHRSAPAAVLRGRAGAPTATEGDIAAAGRLPLPPTRTLARPQSGRLPFCPTHAMAQAQTISPGAIVATVGTGARPERRYTIELGILVPPVPSVATMVNG